MADNTIKYKIIVDKESGTATVRDFRGQIVATQVPLKQLRSEFGNFAKEVNSQRFKEFNNSIKQTRANMTANTRATGAATAATMELGRVISDAPYGIRGMANNVSQLASNVFFMSKTIDEATGKTIGFMGSIKNIGRSLMGSMGVLVAIQSVVAAVEYFSTRVSKAEKESRKLNKTIGDGAAKLSILKDALDNGNLSRKQANEAVRLANQEYKGLNLKLDENNRLTSDSVERMEAQIDMLIKLTKARALQSILEEKYTELLKLQSKQTDLDTEAKEKNKAATEALSESYKEQGISVSLALAKSAEDAAKENKKATDEIQKDINRLLELAGNEGLIEKMFKGKDGKTDKSKKPKAFSLIDLDFIDNDKIAKFNQKMMDAINDSLRITKTSDLIKPEITNLELSDSTKEAISKYNKELLKEFARDVQYQDFSEYTNKVQEGLGAVNDFIGGEFDRRLTIEQNQTNALNEELNQRLLNENLSKDERAKIQQEIWQNDEKLRKKQNEIKKKQFNSQKAFNIAEALINTSRAAAGVMADAKGGFFTRLSQAIPTIAFGLAQVATIARQKFQPEAASTPIRTASASGGSGGVGDRSFNFNLVGASQQNQLAQAIQGTFDKPIKAYVVSKDITNQMALDANTKSTARFGG